MSTKKVARLPVITPRFMEPMYATPVGQLPDGGAWTYEAKLDGYRCLAAKRGDGITLWSRRGTLFTNRFPEIAHACAGKFMQQDPRIPVAMLRKPPE